MSKMFDYISGEAQGREAELEATLEHVMAHCVPGGAYDEIKDALRECMKHVPAYIEERYRHLLKD